MHSRRRGPEQTHRVGTELPVLLGPSVRLGRALVQAQHELQVLVRFLLIRQRPVVAHWLASTAARERLVWRDRLPVDGRNTFAAEGHHGYYTGQQVEEEEAQ